MKSLIIITAIIFAFCNATCGKGEEATLASDSRSTDPSRAKMKITIGTAVFTATLYDNPSANAFKAGLPLTLNMTELNGNEKYVDLPNRSPTNASVGGAIKAGALNLYGDNTLVLFYKIFNTSYRYTRLGYVANPTGLEAALGTGNVVVKFENN